MIKSHLQPRHIQSHYLACSGWARLNDSHDDAVFVSKLIPEIKDS